MKRGGFFAILVSIASGVPLLIAACVSQVRKGMMDGGMMGGMMNVSQHDMSTYMEMFDHHTELRRKVEHLPNGIRTTTESDNLHLVKLLHEHVPSMYKHVNDGQEVRCMSDSLPIMFRNAKKYQRHLALTPKGVSVTETSSDPVVLAAILRHANEVSGFVRDGMPAMMRGMMR
ncbi:MAG TPA: hypothetical protein VN934_09985 [Candidatus Tumulicola sp.]|nr:hypothetical protein [Candidatus Tumulicola sp.]